MTLKSSALLLSAAALALAGCVSQTGPGGVAGTSRTTTGAVTGALIGAAVGANQGGPNRVGQAAVGAVVGGALGGLIGSALDAQARALEAGVSSNTRVVNTGSSLLVTMPQDILFEVNSATLRPDLQRDLDAVAQNLIAYPNSKIQIVGHTDNTGTAALNADLSNRRAQSVANVLRQAGVPGSRIIAFGRGEDFPVASNLTPEGRAANRRVEIIITPTQ
jgi:outer membrane protein OmpA-like peptidoglycan-associated protein